MFVNLGHKIDKHIPEDELDAFVGSKINGLKKVKVLDSIQSHSPREAVNVLIDRNLWFKRTLDSNVSHRREFEQDMADSRNTLLQSPYPRGGLHPPFTPGSGSSHRLHPGSGSECTGCTECCIQ